MVTFSPFTGLSTTSAHLANPNDTPSFSSSYQKPGDTKTGGAAYRERELFLGGRASYGG